MILSPCAGLVVEPLDICLELMTVHAPHTSTTDLDGREIAGTNESVRLRNAYVQVDRHIFEGEEARLDNNATRSGLRGAVGTSLTVDVFRTHGSLHRISERIRMLGFAPVCLRKLSMAA